MKVKLATATALITLSLAPAAAGQSAPTDPVEPRTPETRPVPVAPLPVPANPAQVYVHPADPEIPVTDGWAQRYLRAAKAYWGVDLEGVRFLWGLPPEHQGEAIAAAADPVTRLIWLNGSSWLKKNRRARCESIVHEYGHLLGRGHTTRFRSIMSPLRAPRLIPACHRPR